MRPLLYTVVFVVGGAVMAFEILASRIVAPYFGSNVYVWGTLIGVIMSAMALGYWAGGTWASRFGDGKLPPLLLIAAGLLVAASPWTARYAGDWALATGLTLQYAALLAFLGLCFLPAALMTTIFPFAAHRVAMSEEDFGELTGRLGTVSTVGSLTGTFLTTLVLVDVEWLGTRRSLILTGAAVLACGLALLPKGKRLAYSTSALLLVALGASTWNRLIPPLLPTENLIEARESPYHDVRIVEVPVPWNADGTDVHTARLLRFADSHADQTGIWTDLPGKPGTNLVYDFYFFAWSLKPDIRRVAILGGGGGSVARDILRTLPAYEFPDVRVDIVDIDPLVFELGKKHFDFPLSDNRHRSHVMDARRFLRESTEPYDLILLNAYSTGSQIPEHLLSREFFSEVKTHLAPGGVAALNLLLANAAEPDLGRRRTSRKYLAVLKTLHEVFSKERVHAFATAKLMRLWLVAPTLDYGGVVFLGAEGSGPIQPNFDNLIRRIPGFRGFRGLSLDTLSVGLLLPAVPPEAADLYALAPVLTDDYNPVNLYGR